MGLRAAVIYLAALLMVRIAGDRRFIDKYAAFDVIVSIIFGSTHCGYSFLNSSKHSSAIIPPTTSIS